MRRGTGRRRLLRVGFLAVAAAVIAVDVLYVRTVVAQDGGVGPRVAFFAAFLAVLAALLAAAMPAGREGTVQLVAASASGLLSVGVLAIFSFGAALLALGICAAALLAAVVAGEAPSTGLSLPRWVGRVVAPLAPIVALAVGLAAT